MHVKQGLNLTNTATDKKQSGENYRAGYSVDYKGKNTKLTPKGYTKENQKIVSSNDIKINKSLSTTPSGSFTVQIAAFNGEKIPVNLIDKLYTLKDVRTYKLNGFTKYTSGVFKSRTEADAHKNQLISKGFSGCFVTPLPANNAKVNFNN